MSDIYTVQLLDPKFGRIVLDQLSDSSAAQAATDAKANPPVSGDNASAFNGAGNIVALSQVLKVTGTDANGNAVTSPTALPPVPSADAASNQF